VKMETATLIGKGRQYLTCFVYEVYAINIKIFLLSEVLFLGGYLRFGSIHFPLGGHLGCLAFG